MFDFDTQVDRNNIGNMKNSLLTDSLRDSNMVAFAGAEMDFKTAPVIIQALEAFARRGIYGFTLQDSRYNDAVIWWMQNARDLVVESREIISTLGTMFSLGTAIRAFSGPGDGVIINHPVYNRYEARIISNGRKVVSVPLLADHGTYTLDFTLLERQMSQAENKILVLCNPHNPISKVYSREELQKIGMLADLYDVLVFSDEIFGEITFNGKDVVPFTRINPDRTILCTSLGKVFNLTGVNHANIIIRNPDIREAFKEQQFTDHFGSIDPFFYTALIAGYSPEGLAWVNEMKRYVWNNYQFIQNFLETYLPKLVLSPLEGSFIIWIDFRALGMGKTELNDFLEHKAFLIADNGDEYGTGGDGFMRLNIASPRKNIIDCMENLLAACTEAEI